MEFSAGQLEARNFDVGTLRVQRALEPIALRLEYTDGTPAAGVELVHQMVPQWLQINSEWLRADKDGVVRSRTLAKDAVYTLYIRGGARSVNKNVLDFRAQRNATVVIE